MVFSDRLIFDSIRKLSIKSEGHFELKLQDSIEDIIYIYTVNNLPLITSKNRLFTSKQRRTCCPNLLDPGFQAPPAPPPSERSLALLLSPSRLPGTSMCMPTLSAGTQCHPCNHVRPRVNSPGRAVKPELQVSQTQDDDLPSEPRRRQHSTPFTRQHPAGLVLQLFSKSGENVLLGSQHRCSY